MRIRGRVGDGLRALLVCGWRAVLERWPVPTSRPSKSRLDQTDRRGLAGSLLVSASLCCGYRMLVPPRVPRTTTSKRIGGREGGQPPRRGFRSRPRVRQQPSVGRWLPMGRDFAGAGRSTAVGAQRRSTQSWERVGRAGLVSCDRRHDVGRVLFLPRWMQDQHLPPQLDERRIRQGRGDLFQAGLEESNQVIVTGVTNPDDQQVSWNATRQM